MQAGYAIFNIEVTNPEDYKEYVEKVKPIAEKFGGDYIIRGGRNQIIEGAWQSVSYTHLTLPTTPYV